MAGAGRERRRPLSLWESRLEQGDVQSLFLDVSEFLSTEEGIAEWKDWLLMKEKDAPLDVDEGERLGLVWKTVVRLVESMDKEHGHEHCKEPILIFAYMKIFATAYSKVLRMQIIEETFPRPEGTFRDEDFVMQKFKYYMAHSESRAWSLCYPQPQVYAYLACTAYHSVIPLIHQVFRKRPIQKEPFFAELMLLTRFNSQAKGWAISIAESYGLFV
jgi:hypothetical protein